MFWRPPALLVFHARHCRLHLVTRRLEQRCLINTGPTRSRNGNGCGRLRTLAIETSCDDTSVAVLSVSGSQETTEGSNPGLSLLRSKVLSHDRITSSSEGYGGIHPLVALHSHQQHLAGLVEKAIHSLRAEDGSDGGMGAGRPDFVTVTRGPGMRSNLSVGLDMAKGLALAWDVPLLGVHHMQAHALTPRLCHTLRAVGDEKHIVHYSSGERTIPWSQETLEPAFPFLGVLVSGGHTMLIESRSLVEHSLLAETADIAIGDCLDKAARAILPPELLIAPYGKALERFAFPNVVASYDYTPPARRQEEIERRVTDWGWGINPPLAESKGGGEKSSRRMVYSFAGIVTYVQKLMDANAGRSIDERRMMAREALRVAFEHLASRIMLHLTSLSERERQQIKTIVVSGGVASNAFLRYVLRAVLDVRGFGEVKLEFPPVELCTDNALMIAWGGMEMFNAGFESELSIGPIRKWSMDSKAEDGGILRVGGWRQRGEGWKT